MLRLLATAYPTSSASALGVTSKSGQDGFAAVFCDRAIALRTHDVPLAKILGGTIAHEIVHLLLPERSHSQYGLMRPQWSTEDLKAGRLGVRGLSRQAYETIHREAVRRSAALGTRDYADSTAHTSAPEADHEYQAEGLVASR